MSQCWKFDIVGEPAPWQSYMRQSEQTKGKVALDVYQATVQAALKERWKQEPLSGPIGMRFSFFLLRPKRSKYEYPSKQDLTNLIKAAEDACQGILFVNDSQVCLTEGAKQYTSVGMERTSITVWRMSFGKSSHGQQL